MSFLSSAFNSIRSFYGEINSATLTGAIDVVVVEQKDGSYLSSPFHVRFGKLGVLKAREKIVNIEINGESVDIHMKLDDAGTAFFVEQIAEDECPEHLATSPIPNAELILLEEEKKATEPPATSSSTKALEEKHPPPSTKNKKKRKVRPKHSRSGSKTSLREINPDIFEMDDVDADVDDSDEETGGNAGASNVGASNAGASNVGASNAGASNAGASNVGASNAGNCDKELEELAKEAVSSSRGSLSSINLAEIDNSFLGSRIPRSISEQENLEANLNAEGKSEVLKSKRKETSTVKTDYHYFSEPDEMEKQSAAKTPKRSRSPGGILSDSEYETSKLKPEDDMTTSWRWGELPSTSTPTPVTSPAESKAPKRNKQTNEEKNKEDTQSKDADSKKWSIFNYLRASRKDGTTSSDGVYLDDINDEEMLALYVGTSRKYEDAESGNGTSLPLSPQPIEARHHEDSFMGPNISISLCGFDKDIFSPALFEQSKVTFDDFILNIETNHQLFSDPNLIVKIDDNYYYWKDASSVVMCRVFFKRSLPTDFWPKSLVIPQKDEPEPSSPSTLNTTTHACSDKVQEEEKEEVEESNPKIEEVAPKAEDAVSKSDELLSKDDSPKTKEDNISQENSPPEVTSETKESSDALPRSASRKKFWWSWYSRESKATQESTDTAKTLETLEEVSEKLTSEVKKRSLNNASSGNSSDSSNASWNEKSSAVPSSHGAFIRGKERFKKTLRLSSDEVKRLNLRDGSNEAEFTVTTPYQGTSYCKCHIYLWKYTDKVVISDIDGTITKSDVLGHIFPIIGRDWAQSGVAQLFSKIRQNGYHMIYLSARAIGQASLTKEYLQSIKQGDLCLPDGPLLLNPTSLISAFHREVIERKPEEFKISCLRDIQKLFEDNKNPFYAGYGNRINDSYAYRAVGIPVSRIFTINYRGELKHDLTQTFQTSYCNQSTIVDHLFPPRTDEHDSPTSGQEFCSFLYWREPLCQIELPTPVSQ